MKLFVGAKGLIVRPDGKVLIVRESGAYEEGTEVGNWDVVGGRINVGEPLLDGLKREVTEEAGLSVTVGGLLSVTENFPQIKEEPCHIIRVYYHCTTDHTEVTLSTDHDQYEWIDPREHATYGLMEDLHDIFERYLKLL